MGKPSCAQCTTARLACSTLSKELKPAPSVSLLSAQTQHVKQSNQQTSSKASLCRSVKTGQACILHSPQTSKGHVCWTLAQWCQCCTSSRTERHAVGAPFGASAQGCQPRSVHVVPSILMMSATVQLRTSSHLCIMPSLQFDCSGYADAREQHCGTYGTTVAVFPITHNVMGRQIF